MNAPVRQTGSAMFIALIMLLLITLLVLSSARDLALEVRVAGNASLQQRLGNAAEAGLRDGETSLLRAPSTQAQATCTGPLLQPCVLSDDPIQGVFFDTPGKSRAYAPPGGTPAPEGVDIRWYALRLPAGSDTAESVNAMYGAADGFMGQEGSSGGTATIRYFEVDSRARLPAMPSQTTLRSTLISVQD